MEVWLSQTRTSTGPLRWEYKSLHSSQEVFIMGLKKVTEDHLKKQQYGGITEMVKVETPTCVETVEV